MDSTFGFLLPITLLSKNKDEFIKSKISKLVELYDDVDGDELFREVKGLRYYGKSDETLEKRDFLEFLSWIVEWDVMDRFPNLVILLKIFLTLPVSVASCERSFSKLKLIKNYLRSSMSDERLCGLAMLSIEHELASSLDFSEILEEFASKKARRKPPQKKCSNPTGSKSNAVF